jgi:hypothetical protein
LRYRPPVLMVPYLAKKPFPITDTYTVPKGKLTNSARPKSIINIANQVL